MKTLLTLLLLASLSAFAQDGVTVRTRNGNATNLNIKGITFAQKVVATNFTGNGTFVTNVWSSLGGVSNNFFLGISAGESVTGGGFKNGFGAYALRAANGSEVNGHGYQVGEFSIGDYNNFFGHHSGRGNIGGRNNGFGGDALWFNVGDNVSGLGNLVLAHNTGPNSTAIGSFAGTYNEGSNSIFMGYQAGGPFLDDPARAKTFNAAATSGQLVTITGHGFGATGKWTVLRFNQGSGTWPPFTDNLIVSVEIVDANTLRVNILYEMGTATGTGLTFTPQTVYHDVVLIGNNTVATRSNQIVFASTTNTATLLNGNLQMVGSATVTDARSNAIAGQFAATGPGVSYGVAATATGAGSENVAGYFSASGAADNNYGIRVAVLSGLGNYSIYSDGNARSYFKTNIGVGTTEPFDLIDVSKSASTGMGGRVVINNPGAAAAGNAASLAFKMNDNFQLAGYYSAQIQNINAGVNSVGRLGFFLYDGTAADGVEKASVLSTGRFGVGTNAPDSNLHVTGTAVGEGAHLGNSFVGTWNALSGYAVFANADLKTANDSYAILQSSTGGTYLNAAAGEQISFRINNSTVGAVTTGGVNANGFSSDQTIYRLMETNTPVNGYVSTAVGTLGHTKWAANAAGFDLAADHVFSGSNYFGAATRFGPNVYFDSSATIRDYGGVPSISPGARTLHGESGTTPFSWTDGGIGSTGTNATMVTTSTGFTNGTSVTIIAYVTAATGASLTDNAGTTEFSSVSITAFTPVRVQPGGKFVGTLITYADGTASHAW